MLKSLTLYCNYIQKLSYDFAKLAIFVPARSLCIMHLEGKSLSSILYTFI